MDFKGFTQRFSRILGVKKEPEIQAPEREIEELESLNILLVPKKMVMSDAQDTDEMMTSDLLFGLYAAKLGKSIVNSYGSYFDSRMVEIDHGIDFHFSRKNTSIHYFVRNQDSPEVQTALCIEERRLNLAKAANLAGSVLRDHLIIYRPDMECKLMLFYHTPGGRKSGFDVLNEIGIQPADFAKTVQGGYQHSTLDEVIGPS